MKNYLPMGLENKHNFQILWKQVLYIMHFASQVNYIF